MKKMLAACLAAFACAAVAEDAYLQSNGTQAIETGWFCTPKTKIVADFAFDDVSTTQQRVFGATDDSPLPVGCYINGSKYYAWAFKDDVGNWQSSAVAVTSDRYVLSLDSAQSQVSLTLAGSSTAVYSATMTTTRTKTSSRGLCLFANGKVGGSWGNYAKLRLYSCQIYEDGVKVRDFAPATRNGVAGLWDSVGARFYVAAVGDAFTIAGDYAAMTVDESVWTAGSATFSATTSWQNGQVPAAGYALTFSGAGGTAVDDLAATYGDVTFASGAGAYTVSGLSYTGVLKNESETVQTLAKVTKTSALSPEVGAGLTFSDVTAGGFIPRGTGGAVTLNGENAFAGELVLLKNPLVVTPRVYTQSGYSKDAAGTTDKNVQITYWLRGTGKNTFTGGLEDYTGGQRGDVTILEGDNTFGGNVQATGNDGYLVVRGNLTAASMLEDGSRGNNARLLVESGSLHVRGDLRQTNGDGYHIYLDAPLTVDGELKLTNAGSTLTSIGGTVKDGVRVTAGSVVLGAMSSALTVPLDVGTGGLQCNATKLGGEIGAATADGFTVSGAAVATAATTFRAATTDGTAATIKMGATLTGTAALTKTGAGLLLFTTTSPESYTGTISVQAGSFGYGVTGTAGATVSVADGAALYVPGGQEVTYEKLTLAAGAKLEFDATPNGSGTLVLSAGQALPSPLAVTFSGAQPPPAGTVMTLVKGLNLTSTSGFTFTTVGFGGTASVVDGNLVYTVTQSDYATEELVWAGTDGTAAWDATTANWTKDGAPATFADFARVMFNGSDSAPVVEVAEGLTPGAMVFDAAKSYTLKGAKLNGTGTFTVKGGADVTLDGVAFDAQPIVVENGTLRLGDSVVDDGSVLGATSEPITIKDGGTFDLNVTTNTDGRALATHNKIFKIAGAGASGQGAIINSGALASTAARVHTIELTADATVSADKRWDVRPRTDGANTSRPQVFGTNAVLTITGSGDILCMIDTDVNLKKMKLVDGGAVSLESSSEENLAEGLEIYTGHVRLWNHTTKPFTARVSALDTGAQFGCGWNTATASGPFEVAAGAKLSLVDGGQVNYTGTISGEGDVVTSAGTHYFKNSITAPFTHAAGLSLFDNTHETGDGAKTATVTGGYLAFAPTTSNVYSGYTITGSAGYVQPSRTGTTKTEAVIEDSTIAVKNLTMGAPGQYGFATFGNGTTVTVDELFLGGDGTQPWDATLTIASGATVTLPKSGELQLGRWSGTATNLHKVVISGGTLDMSAANPPRVGYDSRSAEFLVTDGLVKLPGVATRYHKGNNMTPIATPYNGLVGVGYEVFGMSGGTVELGGSFTTERIYPYVPQIWLGGGTLKSTADWSTDYYQYAMFETWGDSRDATKQTFTLDTNGKTVTFRSALQGNANVKITGEGNFVADYNVQGGVSGHWTIENTGTANLKNAAAFSDGITLGEGATATIDIGARDQYASLAVACNANSDASKNEFTWDNFYSKNSVFPSLFTKDFQKLFTMTSTPHYAAFREEAEFYVAEKDTYTFAANYDDRADVVVDGTRVVYNSAWNSVGVGSIELDTGWHRLAVTCNDQAGGAGPSVTAWKTAGLAVGWCKGKTTSTTPTDYQPVDSTTLKMRPVPSVRWNHRYANDATPDDWNSNDTYTFSMVTNSMQAIHNTNDSSKNNGQGVFVYNDGSVNSWTFWSYVEAEQAGSWAFDGVFDDRIGVQIDGKVVFENATWNAAKSATADVTAGWHKFKVTTSDAGGGWSWSGVSNYGAALYVKRPGDTAKVTFDERNICMTAEPYGFIGGTVDLKADSVLVNASTTPADVTGTLTGSGTLDGKYKLLGTWNVDLVFNQKNVATVKWSNGDASALADAKFHVVCDEKPILSRYYLGCAPMGLENLSADELKARLTCELGGEAFDGLSLAIKNNELVLENARPSGITIFLR